MLKVRDIAISECPLSISQFTECMVLLQEEEISSAQVTQVFRTILDNNDTRTARTIAEEKDLLLMKDMDKIEEICKEIIESSPEAAEEYKAGNDRKMKVFMTLLMKKTKGKAPPVASKKVFDKLMGLDE